MEGQDIYRCWERPGALPFPDLILRRAYCDSAGARCRRDPGGAFTLAYPYHPRRPFPLVPLFCFAQPKCQDGQLWLLFSFDAAGRPIFPHNLPKDGDTNPTP